MSLTIRLTVRLTRLSNEKHVFEAVRADGSGERLELETRSLLLHDMVHFALESEGRLADGFFGKLARGETYEASAETFEGETGRIERVVAMLQGAVGAAGEGEVDPHRFVEGARGAFEGLGEPAPVWLDAPLFERTLARLRGLRGQWRATPFGETLELEFSLIS